MSIRRNLSGGWIDVRAAEEITERQARRLRKAARAAAEAAARMVEEGFDEGDPATWGVIDDEGESTAFETYQDALIETYVLAWSWEGPISEAADVLPAKTFAEIVNVCTEENGKVDEDLSPEGAADPLAATGDSNASEPSSAEGSP
jgi:hypothetical protein